MKMEEKNICSQPEEKEVLFSATYKADYKIIAAASCLYGSDKMRQMCSAFSLVGLAGALFLAFSGIDNPLVYLPLIVLIAVLSGISTKWDRFQEKRISKTEFAKLPGGKREIIVHPNEVEVFACNEHAFTYSLDEIKHVEVGELGCFVDFGKHHIVYFPQKAMSYLHYNKLIKFFNIRLMAKKYAKHPHGTVEMTA